MCFHNGTPELDITALGAILSEPEAAPFLSRSLQECGEEAVQAVWDMKLPNSLNTIAMLLTVCPGFYKALWSLPATAYAALFQLWVLYEVRQLNH